MRGFNVALLPSLSIAATCIACRRGKVRPEGVPGIGRNDGRAHLYFEGCPVDGRRRIALDQDRDKPQGEIHNVVARIAAVFKTEVMDRHADFFAGLENTGCLTVGHELENIIRVRQFATGIEIRDNTVRLDSQLGVLRTREHQKRRRHGRIAVVGIFNLETSYLGSAHLAGDNQIGFELRPYALRHRQGQRRSMDALNNGELIGIGRDGGEVKLRHQTAGGDERNVGGWVGSTTQGQRDLSRRVKTCAIDRDDLALCYLSASERRC